MAKIRVVVAEMDGSDESVRSVLAAFAQIAGSCPETLPSPVPQIPSPAVDAPRALPALDAPAAQDDPPRPARPAAKPKRPSVSASADSPLPDSGCIAAILAVLAKGPLTSVDVVNRSKFTGGSVYPALKRLREEGRVEMIEDETDGLRKNRLKV